MTAEIHFVQGGEVPVLVGAGNGTLSCACGSRLIEGFATDQFLAVGIRCGRCGTLTTTPSLPAGAMPPPGLSVAEPSTEPRARAIKVPAEVAVVGRTEMDRLGRLLRPVTPPDTTYHVSTALLDETVALFERHVGGALPLPAEAGSSDPFAGLREHPLGWSVRHLRQRMRAGSWGCMQDAPTANAVTHVAGFRHFVATWSHHPLFPSMLATAGDRGFSLHGLALFAAAHAMATMGNRVGFRPPAWASGRLESFDLATGDTDVVSVRLAIFDRFEFPFGRPWDHASLGAALTEVVAAAQGRINLRAPGVLLVSPGAALPGYDEALIEAVKVAVQSLGRKNRGLMAVAPIVLRLQAMAEPHTVRFGYGLFPIRNRYYGGAESGAPGR